jgi:cell division protease FtsH
MVTDYGMSPMGPINFGPTNDVTQWGNQYWEQGAMSQEVMAQIDVEIKKIIDDCYATAKELINKNRKQLDAVALELVKKESLDDEEFLNLVNPKKKN